jgi:hypothetical protein
VGGARSMKGRWSVVGANRGDRVCGALGEMRARCGGDKRGALGDQHLRAFCWMGPITSGDSLTQRWF